MTDPGLQHFDRLTRVPRVRHAFARGDAFSGFDAARADDRARLVAAVMPGATHVPTRQTHSANVRVIDDAAAAAWRGVTDVDGLVTATPGILLQGISADCPLLLIAAIGDDGAASAVGVAHCGWRGVARGIVDATLAALDDAFAVMPQTLVAAVSPGAGGCCYEVGDEVLEGLAGAGVDLDRCVARCTRGSGKSGRSVDLKTAIASLLEQSGVPSDQIELAPQCSICGGKSFHSYRRDGAAALRMAGVIGIARD